MLSKSANTSTFSILVFVNTSEILEAFLVSKSKTSFSVSRVVTSVKLNLFLPLYLAWIVRILFSMVDFVFYYGF